jgi:hypothetical protein
MNLHFSCGTSSVFTFFFFSWLLSGKRFFFRGISVFDEVRNGDATRTIGGGGDGVNDIAVRSLSIDGGDGEISINSFGECNGDNARVFFSSLTGFVGTGNGFFFGIIFCLTTFNVGVFGGIDSFFTGIVG